MGFQVQRKMLETGPFIDDLLGLSSVEVTTVKLEGPDGNQVELLHFHSHPGLTAWQGVPTTTGLTHIAFTVTELDQLCARLDEFGVQVIGVPQVAPDGAVRVVYARGPENLLLEFVEVLNK
jgi:catechol 2,3-dioxygenase-like lactoylglutathione lyase family enzyme